MDNRTACIVYPFLDNKQPDKLSIRKTPCSAKLKARNNSTIVKNTRSCSAR